MSKYKEVFQDMVDYNGEVFASFQKLHDAYSLNPQQLQKAFNQEGERVLRIIRKYENILCGKSESGKYGKFSSTLSDKFWGEVRQRFPNIDKVGLLS
ncbi:MAG: hypothetical protein AAB478_01355 [Patescibacteria group bacterium]